MRSFNIIDTDSFVCYLSRDTLTKREITNCVLFIDSYIGPTSSDFLTNIFYLIEQDKNVVLLVYFITKVFSSESVYYTQSNFDLLLSYISSINFLDCFILNDVFLRIVNLFSGLCLVEKQNVWLMDKVFYVFIDFLTVNKSLNLNVKVVIHDLVLFSSFHFSDTAFKIILSEYKSFSLFKYQKIKFSAYLILKSFSYFLTNKVNFSIMVDLLFDRSDILIDVLDSSIYNYSCEYTRMFHDSIVYVFIMHKNNLDKDYSIYSSSILRNDNKPTKKITDFYTFILKTTHSKFIKLVYTYLINQTLKNESNKYNATKALTFLKIEDVDKKDLNGVNNLMVKLFHSCTNLKIKEMVIDILDNLKYEKIYCLIQNYNEKNGVLLKRKIFSKMIKCLYDEKRIKDFVLIYLNYLQDIEMKDYIQNNFNYKSIYNFKITDTKNINNKNYDLIDLNELNNFNDLNKINDLKGLNKLNNLEDLNNLNELNNLNKINNLKGLNNLNNLNESKGFNNKNLDFNNKSKNLNNKINENYDILGKNVDCVINDKADVRSKKNELYDILNKNELNDHDHENDNIDIDLNTNNIEKDKLCEIKDEAHLFYLENLFIKTLSKYFYFQFDNSIAKYFDLNVKSLIPKTADFYISRLMKFYCKFNTKDFISFQNDLLNLLEENYLNSIFTNDALSIFIYILKTNKLMKDCKQRLILFCRKRIFTENYAKKCGNILKLLKDSFEYDKNTEYGTMISGILGNEPFKFNKNMYHEKNISGLFELKILNQKNLKEEKLKSYKIKDDNKINLEKDDHNINNNVKIVKNGNIEYIEQEDGHKKNHIVTGLKEDNFECKKQKDGHKKNYTVLVLKEDNFEFNSKKNTNNINNVSISNNVNIECNGIKDKNNKDHTQKSNLYYERGLIYYLENKPEKLKEYSLVIIEVIKNLIEKQNKYRYILIKKRNLEEKLNKIILQKNNRKKQQLNNNEDDGLININNGVNHNKDNTEKNVRNNDYNAKSVKFVNETKRDILYTDNEINYKNNAEKNNVNYIINRDYSYTNNEIGYKENNEKNLEDNDNLTTKINYTCTNNEISYKENNEKNNEDNDNLTPKINYTCTSNEIVYKDNTEKNIEDNNNLSNKSICLYTDNEIGYENNNENLTNKSDYSCTNNEISYKDNTEKNIEDNDNITNENNYNTNPNKNLEKVVDLCNFKINQNLFFQIKSAFKKECKIDKTIKYKEKIKRIENKLKSTNLSVKEEIFTIDLIKLLIKNIRKNNNYDYFSLITTNQKSIFKLLYFQNKIVQIKAFKLIYYSTIEGAILSQISIKYLILHLTFNYSPILKNITILYGEEIINTINTTLEKINEKIVNENIQIKNNHLSLTLIYKHLKNDKYKSLLMENLIKCIKIEKSLIKNYFILKNLKILQISKKQKSKITEKIEEIINDLLFCIEKKDYWKIVKIYLLTKYKENKDLGTNEQINLIYKKKFNKKDKQIIKEMKKYVIKTNKL